MMQMVEEVLTERGWSFSANVEIDGPPKRHVDYIATTSSGGRMAIELRKWPHLVPVEDVLKALDIAAAFSADELMVVARCGFTPEAYHFAQQRGVETLSLNWT